MISFYFVYCSVVWGLTWIAIKYQLNSVDSNVAVFYRFAAASAILFGYLYFKKTKLRFSINEHLNFALQGFFMFCLNYLLTYWAAQMAPSALVALAFTTLIYFNMFGGRLFLSIPFERKVILGALISFGGMALITYNEVKGQTLHETSMYGFLLSLLATLSASAGNLISHLNRQKKLPVAPNNAWGMLYGSFFTLVFCLVTNRNFSLHDVGQEFIWSFIYLTLFGTIFSFGAYLKLIEHIGPSKAAFTSVISPIIAVIVSVMMNEIQLNFILTLGIIFCLVGNVVALVPKHLLRLKKYVHP